MISLRGWLTLLRPPNFLTVPGDVLAGYFLAAGTATALDPRLWMLVGAGCIFYGAGLLLNDWADASIDRVERPDRPIPAGLVSRRAVLFAAVVLLAGGAGLAWIAGGEVFRVGLFLAASVFVYNTAIKHIPVAGALNMGGCRGLNFLLGATLAAGDALPVLAWWGCGTVTAYITAVTHLARREMDGRYWAVERWLPALVLVAAFFAYLPISKLVERQGQVAMALLFLGAWLGAARAARALPNRKGFPADPAFGAAAATPKIIGQLLSLLLPLQGAMIAGAADGSLPIGLGLGIAALWPVKRWLSRFFYVS